MCMWEGVSVELRAGSPLQGPGGRPELSVSRKLEAQILGGKSGGWANSWGTTVHMWPLSEGWAPLLDSEVCLLGQGDWGGNLLPPSSFCMSGHLLNLCQVAVSKEMPGLLFHVSRALSYIYLCSQVGVNQDPSLQGHPSYYSVHPYVLFTMALQDHCFTGLLFFGHVPCKPRILSLFNLIHKHFFYCCVNRDLANLILYSENI